MLYNICAEAEAFVVGAEGVSATKQRQIQIRLNSVRQAATTWSDDDSQKQHEQLEREIHQVTSAKRRLFDKFIPAR
jgi:hypothetical protein